MKQYGKILVRYAAMTTLGAWLGLTLFPAVQDALNLDFSRIAEALYKGVDNQTVCLYAYSATDFAPITAQNTTTISEFVSKDGAAEAALSDTAVSEIDATNSPGVYCWGNLNTTDVNGDTLVFTATSSTTDVNFRPVMVFTRIGSNAGETVGDFVSGSIDADAIATDAIGAAEIAADAIGASELATAAIGTAEWDANSEINTEVDTAIADVNLDHLVGTATGIPALPANTYFDTILDDGTAAYDRTTDSLQEIRDRGDAAWTTGGGGTNITGTAQTATHTTTAVVLASGQVDNDDDFQEWTLVITSGDCQQQARRISDSTASSDTVTLAEALDTNGTCAVDADLDGATYALQAPTGVGQTLLAAADVNTEVDTALTDIGLDHLVSASVTGTDVTDDSIIANMVDDAATADWDNYDNTTAALEALNVDTDAIVADTAVIGAAGAGLTAVPWNAAWDAEVESEVDDSIGGGTGTALTAIPWNAAWDAEAQSEAADALTAYDPPTDTEMDSAFAALNDPTSAATALLTLERMGAILCTVETATSATAIGCDLTTPSTSTLVTAQTDDYIGLRVRVYSSSAVPPALGEFATITDSAWDGGNSALDLTLSTKSGTAPGLTDTPAVGDILVLY